MRYRGGIRVKRKEEGVVTLAAMCILDIDWGKLAEPSSFLCRMEIRWLSPFLTLCMLIPADQMGRELLAATVDLSGQHGMD